MRKKIIAGNWKMYKTIQEAEETIALLANHLSHAVTTNQVCIAAPFPYIDKLIQRFGNTAIFFGAQNISEHAEGAYTGEVSGKMLQSIRTAFVIIGHSERRQYFAETDAQILLKIRAAMEHQLQPFFCCGELLEQRNGGHHFQVIRSQIENTLFQLTPDEISKVAIAYEPVWAIGTGVTATAEQAQEMHAHIRSLVREKFGVAIAEAVSILYGGSVKPGNAAGLFSQPDIDGGLVGGASLQADEFIKIITAV